MTITNTYTKYMYKLIVHSKLGIHDINLWDNKDKLYMYNVYAKYFHILYRIE